MKWYIYIRRWSLCTFTLILMLSYSVGYADTSSSTNYRVDQTFFGSGGDLNACSTGATGYCSKQTAGELAVGNTNSANYQAYAGFNTTDDPYIEFVVTESAIELGYFSTSAPATATSTFYVRAWESNGYSVQIASEPPSNVDGVHHQMDTLSSGGSSVPGTEQFGINLVKNTNFCGVACDLGSNPVQVPDSTFSFGQVVPGYGTSGIFKYNKGDIVARSLKSTSVTIYTVSYLFNIATVTPSGQYILKQNMVATGTY